MNKKIMIIGISIVFMLVAISFASAVNTTNIEKKESPLFRIRTIKTIGEKINKIVDNIKTKFLGERIFSLPFQRLRFIGGRLLSPKDIHCTDCWGVTCDYSRDSCNLCTQSKSCTIADREWGTCNLNYHTYYDSCNYKPNC